MSDKPQGAPSPAGPKPPWYKRIDVNTTKLLLALALPVFLETLDYTVVATAQTHIASTFHRLDLQSYIGTIYLLTSAAFLPVYASLADIFGRHWAMQTALVFFLVGSAISTAAQNMTMMLAGRAIAGIGTAGLLTIVRVILADTGSVQKNNKQASLLFFLYAIGYSAGPSIGGALTSVSFRWVFAINLPCTALAIFLCFFLLRKLVKGPQPPRRPTYADESWNENETFVARLERIDWIGTILFVSGAILLLLGLNWGGSESWNEAKVIGCLVPGGVVFLLSIFWEYALERAQVRIFSAQSSANNKAPSRILLADAMIPFEVMTNYDVMASQFATFTAGMVMLVIFYFVAIFMVIVSGKSPTQAGVQLIFFAPGMGAGSLLGVRLVKRFRQPKYAIILGGVIIPVALGLISMGVNNNNEGQIDGFMVFAGVGVGLTMGPLAVQAQFAQPQERVAIITSLNIFFRTFGGTVGLAQCGTVLNAKVRSFFTSLSASQLATLQGVSVSPESLSSLQSIADLPPPVQALVKDAFRNGIKWCFISLIPWTGVAAIGVLFLRNIWDADKKDEPVTDETTENKDNEEKVARSASNLA